MMGAILAGGFFAEGDVAVAGFAVFMSAVEFMGG